jgi:NDP-sugar pyrophosphorylase family protein
MGITMLEYWMKQFYDAGVEAVMINSYHLQEELASSVQREKWPLPLHVLSEPVLLGTGGGLRNALDFLGKEPFIAVNGDIVCKANLGYLYTQHLHSGEMVSLLLHDCPPFNNVAVDQENRILGFGKEAFNLVEKTPGIKLLAFTGIHFIHPEVLKNLPAGLPFEIIPIYRDLILSGQPPRALFEAGIFWREMGSLESYKSLNRELTELPTGILPPLPTGKSGWVHPDASVESETCLRGFFAIGKGSVVCDGAVLENVILWDGVHIGSKAEIKNCIITDGCVVDGTHADKIITHSNPN